MGVAFLPSAALLVVAQFADAEQATREANLEFRHEPAPGHLHGFMTGGCAVGDFDRDGWPDLFVLGSGGRADALFRNRGDGSFEDVAAAWGVAERHLGTGVSAGDYDGDGWLDLYVTSLGSGLPQVGGHRLYRNTGSGFVDVAGSAGVQRTSPRYPDGFGSSFGDPDLDGDLDLYVAGWVERAWGSRFFRNEGDGSFTDETEESGLYDPALHCFSPCWLDLDGDRYPELLAVADFESSRLFRNLRDGGFADITDRVGVGLEAHGMGCATADFDRNGRADWFATSIWGRHRLGTHERANGNFLYFNEGGHVYTPSDKSTGVGDGGWGWGTVALDFDHDGWTDLAEVNGFGLELQFRNERGYLWRNRGGRRFDEVAARWCFRTSGEGRGLVKWDFDRDGDLDLVVVRNDDWLQLHRNDLGGPERHGLEVALDTSAHPRIAPDGIGARVEVVAGGATRTEWIVSGSSFLSQSELIAHFGLGAETRIDALRVLWPDGFVTRLDDLSADQRIVVRAEPPLSHGPLVRGETVDLTVRGAAPGDEVLFFASPNGPTAPRCPPAWDGLCLELAAPVTPLGRAFADGEGRAVQPVGLREGTPLETWTLQAVVVRRDEPGGGLRTNTSTAAVRP